MIKQGQVRRLALNPEYWLEGQAGYGMGAFVEETAGLHIQFGDQILIIGSIQNKHDEDWVDDPVEFYYRDGKRAALPRRWLETFSVEI